MRKVEKSQSRRVEELGSWRATGGGPDDSEVAELFGDRKRLRMIPIVGGIVYVSEALAGFLIPPLEIRA